MTRRKVSKRSRDAGTQQTRLPSIAPETVGATALSPDPSGADVPRVFDDGFPPPTKAQVSYWRELAGAVRVRGTAGMGDGEWPADLEPTKPTLAALVERGVLSRRKRAWHLRRDWYMRLTAMRERAVPTPRLTVAERPAPDLPTYGELEAWETICRYLDAQPRGRARLPFGGLRDLGPEEEAPVGHLRGMRKHRLVRHTNGCEWALSPAWKTRLQALWHGIERALREYTPPALAPQFSVSLCAGIDTWVLNWLVDEPLPARLRRQLDDLQERARAEDCEVDAPWTYDGVPLRMYRSGTRAESGGGVSWSYVLLNPSLRLLIRKSALGGIIAQARLGSECLWRLTERGALDQLDALVRRMWGRTKGRWQNSQVHLAHDVMHAVLRLEDLERYVSRSRTQAIYDAGRRDVERLLHAVGSAGDWAGAGDGEGDIADVFANAWDDQFASDDPFLFDDPFADLYDDRAYIPEEQTIDQAEDIDDRASTAHRWGRRLSGVTWSPGGAISFVMYDKALESRLKGKHHMEPIWRAAGWAPGEGVTRHEARLRREALRELRAPGKECGWLDDPWVFLEHKHDVWAAVVGRADEECPEAVNVAWVRRVTPRTDDRNRSRWETDPTWRVVQMAPFTSAPSAARRLIRHRQRDEDVGRLDRAIYGLLVSRVALRHAEGGEWDVSMALGEARGALEREAAKPKKDFGALVRERRKARGLSVPVAGKLLPLRPQLDGEVCAEDLALLDEEPRAEVERMVWRERLAERRMREAWFALQEAEVRGLSAAELTKREATFARETQTYEAARRGAYRNEDQTHPRAPEASL